MHIGSNTSQKLQNKRGAGTYKTLEVLGPEHEFSLVDEELGVLPIVDKVLKDYHGRIVNSVELDKVTLGKELQTHVIEAKPNAPFRSPEYFEETMQGAVTELTEFLKRKYNADLLGTGMHPLLKLEETRVWSHRHRQIYQEYSKAFNLKRHGWLNIQSFQLNLPYSNEKTGVLLHNLSANLCAYLPAIAASSPIYEGKVGNNVDNRLHFYMLNQKEIPSVTGDVIPNYVSTFEQYKREIIKKYSDDLANAGVGKPLLLKDWVNSRGAIIRFDRRAIEIRVMDEQECIKSDVALSCLIRSILRGFLRGEEELLSHELLVKDFNSIAKCGMGAKISNPRGRIARQVCQHFVRFAFENASKEEKKYLPIVQKRIESGNLAEIIREEVGRKAQKTDLREAILNVYSKLVKSLIDNQPYF